jgi:asparagine synthase (glutamine-hydrolysing)
MCGICGFTGEGDRELLSRMTGRLSHRGPDDEGYYADGWASLGMRRLSIIDPETGGQPICNENRSVWTVFNGEIYNFPELRKKLESLGHALVTDHSDTEVIVHLYEEYGKDFPRHLNGMFAIALLDREARKLLLVRDRMGVKPLFYAEAGGGIVFASEIKALLTHPAVGKEPDLEAIYHYFSLKNVPAPLTAFAGIRSLLPGEMLEVTGGDVRRSRWWTLRFEEREETEEEIQHQLRSLLDDATRIRMISDVPFGAYLSGGVDSSTVVAFMTRHAGGPVKTFCLGYEDELEHKEADLRHARRVARAFGTEHHEYVMSSGELMEDIDEVVGAFDQPFSGVISTFFLSKLIARHVKVALSGDGADELFGSYLSHRIAAPMRRLAGAGEKGGAGLLTETERKLLGSRDADLVEELFRQSKGEEASWRCLLHVFGDGAKESLLSDGFRASLNGVSTCRLVEEHFRSLTAEDPLNRILEMEWNTQLPDQVLAFVDFLSMAHSVEVRSPFLDYRVVELAARVPGRLKIRDGNVKDVLKRAVAPVLPEGIVERPKEGFVMPIFHWMMESLSGFCTSVLAEERLRAHGLLRPEAVAEVLKGHRARKPGYAGRVWNLVMFQLWWEKYFG